MMCHIVYLQYAVPVPEINVADSSTAPISEYHGAGRDGAYSAIILQLSSAPGVRPIDAVCAEYLKEPAHKHDT